MDVHVRRVAQMAPKGSTVVPILDFQVPLAQALVWRADERRPVIRTVMNVARDVAAEERARRDGRATVRSPAPTLSTLTEKDRVAPSNVLELRHLRYFCAVSEAGSFGRAAEQLGLTQPTLSRQVADLEGVVAIPLLERITRGVSATPAGDAFMRSARRILDEVSAMSAETQRARRGVIARCVVAMVPTMLARKLVAALVRECAKDEPQLELVFEEIATPEQPEALRTGRIDLGLCHTSPLSAADERGIERVHILSDAMNCALVAAGSPLASRRSLSIRELTDVPFIFPDRGFQPAMYDFLFKRFEGIGFRPRVDDTYDGLRTIWHLVAQGHGWAMGFASQCAEPPHRHRSRSARRAVDSVGARPAGSRGRGTFARPRRRRPAAGIGATLEVAHAPAEGPRGKRGSLDCADAPPRLRPSVRSRRRPRRFHPQRHRAWSAWARRVGSSPTSCSRRSTAGAPSRHIRAVRPTSTPSGAGDARRRRDD
jgi:DNA-binding transcriptional LysR family regulator